MSMTRRLLPLAALLCLLAAAPARAAVFGPPPGKVFTGMTGSLSTSLFGAQVGKHPAVLGYFTEWYGGNAAGFTAARATHSRLMLHISTTHGYGQPEHVTPLGIARGQGDSYLLALNRKIAEFGEPVYVRLMAEMNQTNNAYCAFNRNGSSRGPAHSTAAFKNAWRRAALILRGGPVSAIDAELAGLHLPPVAGKDGGDLLPEPQVSLLWVPQTEGSPAIARNSARAYWPGARYVDWVGTDFYSKFPNFSKLETFYRDFKKPFVFGEWALWGGDDPGFVSRLFRFVNTHRRVQMMLYNQGNDPNGPFRLKRFPRARAAIRHQLRSARYLASAD
jgi:hypothetical protein